MWNLTVFVICILCKIAKEDVKKMCSPGERAQFLCKIAKIMWRWVLWERKPNFCVKSQTRCVLWGREIWERVQFLSRMPKQMCSERESNFWAKCQRRCFL
jgi:hypothetical protein